MRILPFAAGVVTGAVPHVGGRSFARLLDTGVRCPTISAAQEPESENWLFLTVTRGDARHGDPHGTLLLCDPPQGHRRAAEACAELAKAGGDISSLRTPDAFCPMVYAPVTAHARGQWHGRPVEYRETFANGCAMGARTGTVFALDG